MHGESQFGTDHSEFFHARASASCKSKICALDDCVKLKSFVQATDKRERLKGEQRHGGLDFVHNICSRPDKQIAPAFLSSLGV